MNDITKNQNKLIDPFGRDVNYLRVSVTYRCDFRCTYCMAEDMQFLPKKDILSLEEIEDICRTFMKLGTRKIRLTGGEPLVRKGIMQVINNLGKEVGTLLDELTITTNGSQLESKAEELYRAGVRRINVSLDHLDPVKFKEITRWGDLEKVKRGLKKAREVGLKIKINTDFIGVIEACSEITSVRENTWINPSIRDVFIELHYKGYAHSVECYSNDDLVGGLYGVAIGGMFYGESMFSRMTNASKVALLHLIDRLKLGNFILLDTQFITEHLKTMGAYEIDQESFLIILKNALKINSNFYKMSKSGELDMNLYPKSSNY